MAVGIWALVLVAGYVILMDATRESPVANGTRVCGANPCTDEDIQRMNARLPATANAALGPFLIASGATGIALSFLEFGLKAVRAARPHRPRSASRPRLLRWLEVLSGLIIVLGLLLMAVGWSSATSSVACTGNRAFYGGAGGGGWVTFGCSVSLASPIVVQFAITTGLVAGVLFGSGLSLLALLRIR